MQLAQLLFVDRAGRMREQILRALGFRESDHVAGLGQAQAEDVLGVAGDAGRITMAPDRVDLVDVGKAPVACLLYTSDAADE